MTLEFSLLRTELLLLLTTDNFLSFCPPPTPNTQTEGITKAEGIVVKNTLAHAFLLVILHRRFMDSPVFSIAFFFFLGCWDKCGT